MLCTTVTLGLGLESVSPSIRRAGSGSEVQCFQLTRGSAVLTTLNRDHIRLMVFSTEGELAVVSVSVSSGIMYGFVV